MRKCLAKALALAALMLPCASLASSPECFSVSQQIRTRLSACSNAEMTIPPSIKIAESDERYSFAQQDCVEHGSGCGISF